MSERPATIVPPEFDLNAMRRGRLARLRATMVADGLDLVVLSNPLSIRYATDYRGYAAFQAHIPTTYALIGVDGPVVVHGAYADDLGLIDISLPANSATAFDAGMDLSNAADRQVADVLRSRDELGLGIAASIGIERATPSLHRAYTDEGITLIDAEPTIELARSRKSELEMVALRYSIDVAEYGMRQMEAALEPGITENQLWAILHATNIAHNGDWIDGRMLASGPRSNPWYQEASGRVIEAGDVVPFDSDMIGPFGYCADISRTFLCGDQAPTGEQLDLYKRSLDEIWHNTELLRVGASFEELSHSVMRQPEEINVNRYACAFHGVGLSDEYPKIPYTDDWDRLGYDGEIEDGLVLSVESYVGPLGGSVGIKLEQMVQVTSAGIVALSTYPFWDL